MERTKPEEHDRIDLEKFREDARERANKQCLSMQQYLALQIYASAAVLKGELDVVKETMTEKHYVALSSDVQEIYEGSRLLASEVA